MSTFSLWSQVGRLPLGQKVVRGQHGYVSQGLSPYILFYIDSNLFRSGKTIYDRLFIRGFSEQCIGYQPE